MIAQAVRYGRISRLRVCRLNAFIRSNSTVARTGCSASEDEHATQHKMFGPAMSPRIGQANHPARLWIERGQVGAFVLVAVIAGQRQVAQQIAAAMLSRDDVLNLMPEKRRIVLAKPAILAVIGGSRAYGLTLCGGHPNA
ncbi:MAG TPA: hypothetical protein VLJ39_20410, partial [Tepidisphaeraceae bacterium]|nr:hypothetical protein [Tepidisphaeraceae bacterium]